MVGFISLDGLAEKSVQLCILLAISEECGHLSMKQQSYGCTSLVLLVKTLSLSKYLCIATV